MLLTALCLNVAWRLLHPLLGVLVVLAVLAGLLRFVVAGRRGRGW